MQTTPPPLAFRDFRQSDLSVLAQAMGDARVTRFYGLETHHTDAHAIAREQLDWYRQLGVDGEGWWQAICVGASGAEAIGGIGLYDRDDDGDSAELGYWLLPGHWGQGIMKAALRQWLPGAFHHLALHSVVAYVEQTTPPPAACWVRLGSPWKGCCANAPSARDAMYRCSAILCWRESWEPRPWP